MKLSEAKRIALKISTHKHPYNYIAVDYNDKIYAYTSKPELGSDIWYGNQPKFIGNYTGSKLWFNTLRYIK